MKLASAHTNIDSSSNHTTIDNVVELFPKKKNPRNYNKNGESQEVYPFKDERDIYKIQDYILTTGYNDTKYRDYMLFNVGINVGLRCGDLVKLKWEDILDDNGNIKDMIIVLEEKTKYSKKTNPDDTKIKKRSYKKRKIFFNEVALEAINLYLHNTDESLHTGYIFKSQRNPHLEVRSVNKMIKTVAKAVSIPYNVGTHSLRKTFGYHMLKENRDNVHMIAYLQDIFNHSSSKITLRYCGLEDDDFKQFYNNLNVGKR